MEEETLLCPVRAMRFYLHQTKSILPSPSNLFVSPRRRQRAITKNVISFFLRETISGAGAVREGEHQYLRAHSIRVVSTSLSFNKSWSVKQVLSAVTWRSNSVFASFYMKKIYHISGTTVSHWVPLWPQYRL